MARTEEELDRIGESAGEGSRSINRLARAVDATARAFGGVISGAPQSISEFAGGLTDIVGAGGPLAKMVQFAEGYTNVWQGLTGYGVNFSNQLDQMIITAGRANMGMEQLDAAVRSSSVDFAGLGPTANRGVQGFLARQADFYRNFQDLDMSLRQLGMTTDDINERFLQFDAMSNVNNLRQRLTDNQRQQAAARFAESVDTLARLTGKQADELAREQLELSRQGNIYARDQQLLGKETQGTTAAIVTRFNAMGEDVGNVVTDFLTRGFPDANDPAFIALNSMAPQLQNYLGAIRRAQDAGDLQEVERMSDEMAVYLEGIRRSRRAQYLAQLGSATDVTAAANRILTAMNNSAELLSSGEVRARMIADGFDEAAITTQTMAEYRRRLMDEERAGQRSGQGTRTVTDLMLKTLQQLQLAASTAQERTVTSIFTSIEDAAGELRDGIAGIDWQAAVNSAISNVTGVAGMLSRTQDIRGGIQGIQDTLTFQSRQASRSGDQDLADLLSDSADAAGQIVQDLEAGRIDEAEARRRALALSTMIQSTGDMTISHRGPLTLELQEQINALGSDGEGGAQQNAIGTLGRTGRFFANFGPGTNVRLDGIEGIFRPEHVEEIMERSSRGTMQSLVNEILSRGSTAEVSSSDITSSFRNITSTLDGRLNTLRASVSREIRSMQPSDTSAIAEQVSMALEQMPQGMRRAFEEALGSTIKQPIEQLVSVSTRGTEYQERVYKNTKGLSNDYLRGA